MSDFTPQPAHLFSFGLWTVGNIGRDPFGQPVRAPMTPAELVRLLAEIGAWGVNLHDNDLVPIDATPAERDQIVRDFKAALAETGLVVPMATTNLFSDPVFKDGAFTSNDPQVRAYALQKTMQRHRPGRGAGREDLRVLGRARGQSRPTRPRTRWTPCKRFREAMNFLCDYSNDQGYDLKFALEAKPNEPRGDIYLPTTGHMLAFIETLDHPEMVGVNPEMAHEHMAGLNFLHAVAQAWEAGKLFHIDLNDQKFAPLRPGFPLRRAQPEAGVLPGQVPGGRGLQRLAPLRRARLPHRGLCGREGLRARLHAHLPDPEGEGRVLERRPGNPGAAPGD